MAQILGPHGVVGEVMCRVLTDFPDRFKTTREVFVGESLAMRKLERQRLIGDRVILKIEGVEDRSAAERLRGALIRVPLDQAVKLPPGTYFWHEIVGLVAQDQSGRNLGEIVDILKTGSNDVYVVRGAQRELLLPAIGDVVRQIDPEQGVMIVELIPGLEN